MIDLFSGRTIPFRSQVTDIRIIKINAEISIIEVKLIRLLLVKSLLVMF